MAKNVTVQIGDPAQRAQIEARRGIARDGEGRIVRSAQWKKQRVEFLEAKREDIKRRLKNLDAELKNLTK